MSPGHRRVLKPIRSSGASRSDQESADHQYLARTVHSHLLASEVTSGGAADTAHHEGTRLYGNILPRVPGKAPWWQWLLSCWHHAQPPVSQPGSLHLAHSFGGSTYFARGCPPSLSPLTPTVKDSFLKTKPLCLAGPRPVLWSASPAWSVLPDPMTPCHHTLGGRGGALASGHAWSPLHWGWRGGPICPVWAGS